MIEYREYSFLQNKRLPEAVKASSIKVGSRISNNSTSTFGFKSFLHPLLPFAATETMLR